MFYLSSHSPAPNNFEMDENTNIAKNTILETLSLKPTHSKSAENEEISLLNCIFCDHSETNDLKAGNKTILQHMFRKHRLVIADVQDVSDLSSYLKYWKIEFTG